MTLGCLESVLQPEKKQITENIKTIKLFTPLALDIIYRMLGKK
jgi:hypothetical protein